MNIGFDASDLCSDRADGTTRYTRELLKRLPQVAPQDEWHAFAPCGGAGERIHWHPSPWPKYWTQSRLPVDLYRYPVDTLFMPIQQIPYIRPRHMKTVAVIHDLAVHVYPEQFRYKDWLLLHLFSAYVARQADELIAVSEATARDIEHYYGRTDNVHVIHHGVDHTHFRPPVADELASSWHTLMATFPKLAKPYLLYVGQIQPRKNLIRLIEAFERVHPERPELQLAIAGAHGWLNAAIYQRIKKSPAQDKIAVLGRVTDQLLTPLYWHASALALPSLYEGFGMPILEAMASGCPVVTSNVSSLPEIADDAAVLVDPLDVEAIARGIGEALSRGEDLRQRGYVRATEFTWEKTAEQTLAVIKA